MLFLTHFQDLRVYAIANPYQQYCDSNLFSATSLDKLKFMLGRWAQRMVEYQNYTAEFQKREYHAT